MVPYLGSIGTGRANTLPRVVLAYFPRSEGSKVFA